MKVYCQNFKKHVGAKPVLCEEVGTSFSQETHYKCPECGEWMEFTPEYGGESRAGYPKSMIRKM